MKVIILAGGLPSTISEENERIPKPMVQIGERPILWHIMKLYSHHGYNDFIICTGYRSDMIKEYFLNYYIYRSDITVDLQTNDVTIHNNISENWNVTIVDTGLEANTAERIKKVEKYIDSDDFLVTYGDCISNINIEKLVEYHKYCGKLMTVSVAKPTGRNTILPLNEVDELSDTSLSTYLGIEAWANACNLVINKKIFEKEQLLSGRLEIETMNELAKSGDVSAYKHVGMWLPVETMRDKLLLESMWKEKNTSWKVWMD